jgi:pilus assembly protein CpaC
MITRKQEIEVNTMSTGSRGGWTRLGVTAPLAVAFCTAMTGAAVAGDTPAAVAPVPKQIEAQAPSMQLAAGAQKDAPAVGAPRQIGGAPSAPQYAQSAVAANADAAPAVDNPPARQSGPPSNILRVLTGKSLLIDLKNEAKRVSVANPQVAEVMVISPRQVMVNGLADGETSVIVWDRGGNYKMYSLIVGEAVADQVMLNVTVAEINRTQMEQHGVDIRNFGGQFNFLTNYGGVAPVSGQHPPSASQPPFPVSLTGLSWAIVDSKNDIAAIFKQLQNENLGKILAEPKLLARSGKKANFLSGGEIPIVITTNDDTSIEFKEYGTKIDFVPRVREDGNIDLTLASEVSEPDYAAGVELFGFSVPAFVTRRAATDVTLQSGESLIVAGLIKETKQELESKMPFLGDVPFVGYFFRSTSFENDVLELMMVVRPELVAPISAGRRVALPTDRGPLTREEVRTGPVEEKVSRPRPY